MKNIPTTYLQQPAPVVSTPNIVIPSPLSYDFRVVEYVKDGAISKVRMEVRVNQHDQYGNLVIEGMWEEVPRIQINT